MKLTGKALKDFSENMDKINPYWNLLDEVSLSAHIIYWLDSAGNYIQHWNSDGSQGREFDFDISYNGMLYSPDDFYNTRTEATNKAIEKANQIYNERPN